LDSNLPPYLNLPLAATQPLSLRFENSIKKKKKKKWPRVGPNWTALALFAWASPELGERPMPSRANRPGQKLSQVKARR
jgi:hypothetical protein